MTQEQKNRARQMADRIAAEAARKSEAVRAARPAPPPKPVPTSQTKPAKVERIAATTGTLQAVQTGITKRTAVLTPEDAAAYESHIQRLVAVYEPVGNTEEQVVQSIADVEWRLLRIPGLEQGIYAIGRLEFKTAFDQEDISVRPALIEAQTFLKYQRQLNSLSTQEVRLRRQLDQDLAALERLQVTRSQEEKQRLNEAALHYLKSQKNNEPFDIDEFGFEFSIEEIKYAAYHIEQARKMISPFTIRPNEDAA